MNMIETTIDSKILGKRMNLSVYCPKGFEDTDIPVLYFLHGRTGDESILKQLGMDKTAEKLIAAGKIDPLLIVCPNLDNSRGINSSEKYVEIRGRFGMVHKGQYEDYLIQELIPYVQKIFHAINDRKARYIGGISAGGYAALHIGLRYQNLFSRIGGHMPAIDLSYADEDECYYTDEAMWKKYDPITIAENNSLVDIEVFLDDGKDDEGQFYRACDKLTSILEQKGVKVQNHLYKGRHDVEYVRSNLENYLRFYSRNMG